MKLFRKQSNQPEKEPSTDRELLQDIRKQLKVVNAKLDTLSERVIALEEEHKETQAGVMQTLANSVILYGKNVLTRLNFLELSRGEEISMSSNERKEIEAIKSKDANPSVFPIPDMDEDEREQAKQERLKKLN